MRESTSRGSFFLQGGNDVTQKELPMDIRHVLMLSTAVALTAIGAGTASSQTTPPTRTPTTFLTPLPARFVFTPLTSTFCRNLPSGQCPPALVYGGAAGPGLPTIDPALKADLPNVRVSFVLNKISNNIVDGGGVNTGATTFVYLVDHESGRVAGERRTIRLHSATAGRHVGR